MTDITDPACRALMLRTAGDLKRLFDDLVDIRMQLAQLPDPQSVHRVQVEVAALRRDMDSIAAPRDTIAAPRVDVPAWMAHASAEELRLITEVTRAETAAIKRQSRALARRVWLFRCAALAGLMVTAMLWLLWVLPYAATGL